MDYSLFFPSYKLYALRHLFLFSYVLYFITLEIEFDLISL